MKMALSLIWFAVSYSPVPLIVGVAAMAIITALIVFVGRPL